MEKLSEQEINELRKVLGIDDQESGISSKDMSICTSTKGSYQEGNNADKIDNDSSMLEKKCKELVDKYNRLK